MDFDSEKKLDAAAAAAVEKRSAAYSMALLDTCALYLAEVHVLRELLFESGAISRKAYDAALRGFLSSHWKEFRGDMNQKIRAKTKEYLAHLGEPEKGH